MSADRIDSILADPLEGLVEEVEFFVDAILAGLLLSENAAGNKQRGHQGESRQPTHAEFPPSDARAGQSTGADRSGTIMA